MIDERAVPIDDAGSLGGSFGRIALLRDGFFADETSVGAVEALHKTSRELPLIPQPRTAGLVGEKILERAIVLAILVEEPEDALHALPHRSLQRHLAAIGSIVFAEHGHRGEPGFVEESTRHGCFPVNELGAKLDRNAGVRIVEGKNSTADPRARFEHRNLHAGSLELART